MQLSEPGSLNANDGTSNASSSPKSEIIEPTKGLLVTSLGGWG